MEFAKSFMGNPHGGTLTRYSKGSEPDNGCIGGFFGMDDLLKFSDEDIGGPIGEVSPTFSEHMSVNSSLDRSIFQMPTEAEVFLPCDDLAEVEWLSDFAEESFSAGNALTCVLSSTFHQNISKQSKFHAQKSQVKNGSPVSVLESSAFSEKHECLNSEMGIRGRARSKRSRAGLCIWNTQILSTPASVNLLDSLCNSTVTNTASWSHDMDALVYKEGASCFPQKRVRISETKTKRWLDSAQTRRCLHCGSQKTPQWRAGPVGPKTLCNACGVRHKSGRLLPEYRPVASPTFVESLHSNSHKKVLEMRRQKEGEAQREEPFTWQQQQHLGSSCKRMGP